MLIDSNADLIGCYETVRDAPDDVARELDRLAEAHARGGRAQYYAVRDGQFNPLRDRLRRADGQIAYTPALAAMLIYLNRTGFNGLFRLNARGAFNVPAGRYDRPNIVDRGRLARVAEALSGAGLRLVCGRVRRRARCRGSRAISSTSIRPTRRSAARRTSRRTRRRASTPTISGGCSRCVIELARRGCHVLLSNSTGGRDRRALREERRARGRAGLRVRRVPARRAINSNAARRGVVDEFLITNIDG